MDKNFSFAVTRIVLGAALTLGALTSQAATSTWNVPKGDRYYVDHNEQCVTYVRRFVQGMPAPLNTKEQKRKIKNTSTPKQGRVAIIMIGTVGHLGYIVAADTSGAQQSITYVEANNPLGRATPRYVKVTCSKISKCEAEAKIYGYWKP
jgi:hypothetical protein